MASPVSISAMALGHLGARVTIASIDPPDGTFEAAEAARVFPDARRELLEAGSFAWSRSYAALAQAVDNPSPTWVYAYVQPSDCVKPLRVLPAGTLAGSAFREERYPWELPRFDFTDRSTADFDRATLPSGQVVILSNEPDATLVYIRDVPDIGRWSPKACTALSYLMASYMAGPILRGKEGVQASASLRDAYEVVLGQARAADANSTGQRADHYPAHLAARSG